MRKRWHSVERGSGRAIVLLHGGMGLDHTYLRSCDALQDAGRLIYLDQLGNGCSEDPPTWDGWSYRHWAEDLEQFRRALEIPSWSIVAHSAAVFVALEYALAYPQSLDRLVMICGAASMAHWPVVVENMRAYANREIGQLAMSLFASAPTTNEAFQTSWQRVLPIYFHRWEPRYLSAFQHTKYRARALTAAPLPDLLGRVSVIEVPTLVVSGDHDFITPAREAGWSLASVIAGARHEIIEDSGHFPMIEQPREFALVVGRFFGTCP